MRFVGRQQLCTDTFLSRCNVQGQTFVWSLLLVLACHEGGRYLRVAAAFFFLLHPWTFPRVLRVLREVKRKAPQRFNTLYWSHWLVLPATHRAASCCRWQRCKAERPLMTAVTLVSCYGFSGNLARCCMPLASWALEICSHLPASGFEQVTLSSFFSWTVLGFFSSHTLKTLYSPPLPGHNIAFARSTFMRELRAADQLGAAALSAFFISGWTVIALTGRNGGFMGTAFQREYSTNCLVFCLQVVLFLKWSRHIYCSFPLKAKRLGCGRRPLST